MATIPNSNAALTDAAKAVLRHIGKPYYKKLGAWGLRASVGPKGPVVEFYIEARGVSQIAVTELSVDTYELEARLKTKHGYRVVDTAELLPGAGIARNIEAMTGVSRR